MMDDKTATLVEVARRRDAATAHRQAAQNLRTEISGAVQDALDAGWTYRGLAAELGVSAGAIVNMRAYTPPAQ